MPNLAIIDDDPGIAEIISTIATSCGFEAHVFASGHDFISASEALPVDAIVMDIFMPDMDGIELLQWITRNQSKSRIILVSGYGEIYLEAACKLAEADGLRIQAALGKPFGIAAMEQALNAVHAGAGPPAANLFDFPRSRRQT